jgi:ATP-dependent Clp protease protease subunit
MMNKVMADYKQSPIVLEERQLKATAVDVFSRLMMDRIIFLGDHIDEHVGNTITAQLLWLNTQDSTTPIQMYINSPGGYVKDGLMIYDTMQLIKAPVHTICTGQAASMAAVILAGGDIRSALPNSEIMIHQPMGGAWGQSTDVMIAAKQIDKTKIKLASILSKHTDRSLKQVLKDIERDNWMDPEEALDYGIIDEVIRGKKNL